MNNVKKIARLSFLSAVLMTTFGANAQSGTLSINGSIVDSTCVIKAEHLSQTVSFEAITPSELSGAAPDQEMASKNFSFDVDSCPAGISRVGVLFNYNGDSNEPTYIENTGDAEGVLLAITDVNDTRVSSGSPIWSTDYNASTGSGTVEARVKAHRVGTDAPVAGDINSVATIALTTN